MRFTALATITLLLLAVTARAETYVMDGDTIAIDGQRVRLFGIDSPERGKPGAVEAADNLHALIGQGDVKCTVVDYDDRNQRPVSLCSVEGHDLSLAQVRAGHAVVWCSVIRRLRPRMLATFRRAEAEARDAKRGIWSRPFKPWRQWRC